MSDTPAGLAKMREDFPSHQISKLPKPTKAQTEALKENFKIGIRCPVCQGWHHKDVIHLDYVGHAALTDRLLDCDPGWTWEPCAMGPDGLPAFDKTGGLWIRLTVCGVTRLGYGNAAAKPGADPGAREKECIGDALRNAAMRFGAALDLWHKGKLHAEDDDAPTGVDSNTGEVLHASAPPKPAPFVMEHWLDALEKCSTADELSDFKSRGMMAAEVAKNESGYRAIRTEANRLAKLKGFV
jgi:hypothetical protein